MLYKMSLGDTSQSEEARVYPDCIENGYVCHDFAREVVRLAIFRSGWSRIWNRCVSELYGFIEYLYILVMAYLEIRGPGPLSADNLLVRLLSKDRGDEPSAAVPSAVTAWEEEERIFARSKG